MTGIAWLSKTSSFGLRLVVEGATHAAGEDIRAVARSYTGLLHTKRRHYYTKRIAECIILPGGGSLLVKRLALAV